MQKLLSDEYLTSGAEKPTSEQEQALLDKTHDALDAMRDLPIAIVKLVAETVAKHHLNIDMPWLMGALDDVFSDATGKEWVRLMRISGSISHGKTPDLLKTFENMYGNAPREVEADFVNILRSNN